MFVHSDVAAFVSIDPTVFCHVCVVWVWFTVEVHKALEISLRSANRKRLQRLLERAEAGSSSSKSKRRSGNNVIMKDIKKDERYKAVEEMFSGKSKRRSGGGGSSTTAEYRSVLELLTICRLTG